MYKIAPPSQCVTEEKENIGKMPTIMKIINGDNTSRKDDRNINKGSPILSSMNLILKLVYSTKLFVPRNGRSKINKDIENKITS